MAQYDWIANKNENSKCSAFAHIYRLFIPNVLAKYEWKMFSSLRRFLLVVWFVFVITLLQNTGFFLKYMLWIPSDHMLIVTRVWLWAGISMFATKDMYLYVENKNNRFGMAIWLSHFTILLEMALNGGQKYLSQYFYIG